MEFKCGHEHDRGVGDNCWDCHKRKEPKPKPKKKMGPPVVRTPEEMAGHENQYQAEYRDKNRVKLRGKSLKLSRERRNVVKAFHVIELNGSFKRGRRASPRDRWDSFSLAHSYTSRGQAVASVAKSKDKGAVVMKRMSTEAKTRAHHEAEMMKESA